MTERLFLYPAMDGTDSVVVWDMDSQQAVGRLHVGDAEAIYTTTAKGNFAISSYGEGVESRLWNLETFQCVATLPTGPGDEAYAPCLSESRAILANDDRIKVWDIAASAPVFLYELDGHTDDITDIKASDSGDMAISCSWDGTARLWDLRTGEAVRTLAGHVDVIFCVDMDGDGRTAVSGGGDTTAKLWDLGSGRCVETYEGHTGSIQNIVMRKLPAGRSSSPSFLSSSYDDYFVNAWAVGSTKAVWRADMASAGLPDTDRHRMFANRDLSLIALCCIGTKELDFRAWR